MLEKELRVRFRKKNNPAVTILSYLFGIGTVLFVYQQAIYYVMTNNVEGKNVWSMLLGLQGFLIWLMCPAAAANAITQEKEQQSWQSLVFTKLNPLEILFGKFLVRLIAVTILLLAFLPLNVYCTFAGGVEGWKIFLEYLTFAIWAVFNTTMSLFFSWLFKRTASAITLSYVVVLFLSIGTVLIESTFTYGTSRPETVIVWLNPFYLMSAMMASGTNANISAIFTSNVIFSIVVVALFYFMSSRLKLYAMES